MPNPINASFDPALCSSPDDVTAEENDAQMNLMSAHPAASATPSAATAPNAQPAAAAPTPPPSPAVSALVSRFTAPTGMHPPVEPSLTKALLNCKAAVGNYLINFAAVAISAPDTLGASLVAGSKVMIAGANVTACLDQNEAQQVSDGNRANQADDCRTVGAIPLTTSGGAVVCAK
ncbi:MAG TPA: hypothetical protein VK745_09935 [Polyangiaceae bacterium]|jgi:hypothetical protein|nr:hypothetical protein [Polyangiaceae bacterium]